jgi:ribosomal protein L35
MKFKIKEINRRHQIRKKKEQEKRVLDLFERSAQKFNTIKNLD